MLPKNVVEFGLKELNLRADKALIQQLHRYQALLLRWNKTINLTGIKEPDKIITHHLMDALSVNEFLVGKRVLDVGSGAGLPGIPLALINPDKDFILLDSNGKKTHFMTQALIDLGLKNVTVVKSRLEDYDDCFDHVVCRAFSSLEEFARQGLRLLNKRGSLLAMKGPGYEVELVSLKVPFKQVHRIDVPTLGAERYLVEVSAIRRCPQ